MEKETFGFIGLGLIGGSIARGLRSLYPECEILAYNRSKQTLYDALEEHVANRIFEDLDETALHSFGACDYVFLCAPVTTNNEHMRLLVPYLSDRCILTDVGSVKSPIHKLAKELNIEDHFIGGHPMTGSEKTGFSNAAEHLLENAYYILTPTESVPKERADRLKEIVKDLHCIPLMISPTRHDYITGAISHLPHVIAASLVNLVHSEDEDGNMKLIAAGGFKDITRIASSSAEMWQSICTTNADNISVLLDHYIESLLSIRKTITNAPTDPDAYREIYDLFDDAKHYRDSFVNKTPGRSFESFDLYVDLKDEAGAIAGAATLLANANINIKNIGVMHNREFQQGALRIEFYEEKAMKAADDLFKKNGYTVFPKHND
ncbi:MAG: prephenate dehydrogenase [Lachnospiraceae bacterium]|nr:prephenate dehydrogenase [Lachnospiraceae bacterium]